MAWESLKKVETEGDVFLRMFQLVTTKQLNSRFSVERWTKFPLIMDSESERSTKRELYFLKIRNERIKIIRASDKKANSHRAFPAPDGRYHQETNKEEPEPRLKR